MAGVGTQPIRLYTRVSPIDDSGDAPGFRGCLGCLPEWAFKLESAPHDWLFPSMGAIIHHGGAGTTASALRAGVPSIVMPFFGDQFFWAQAVTRLGVSPGPIYRKELNQVETIADAIRTAVIDANMRARAEALGERIRGEDGIGYTVALFREFLGKSNG